MGGNSVKGRKLPPLLPVEYCRLDRAARMLECEVEDLLHWGSTGELRLLHLARGIETDFAFNFEQMAYLLESRQKIDPLFTQLAFTWELTNQHSVYINFRTLYENDVDFHKAFKALTPSVEPFSGAVLFASIRLYGFFDVEALSVEELYLNGSCETLFLSLDRTEVKQNFSCLVEQNIEPEQLFINKAELERVYQAITTGCLLSTDKEKLPFPETMQRISDAKAAVERNSAPRAELVLSLLELVLGEESSLIDNPYALYQRVNKQLREAKIIEPEITEQAFADILSKAKSARKNRLNNQS
jgi:hypothetical protein